MSRRMLAGLLLSGMGSSCSCGESLWQARAGAIAFDLLGREEFGLLMKARAGKCSQVLCKRLAMPLTPDLQHPLLFQPWALHVHTHPLLTLLSLGLSRGPCGNL